MRKVIEGKPADSKSSGYRALRIYNSWGRVYIGVADNQKARSCKATVMFDVEEALAVCDALNKAIAKAKAERDTWHATAAAKAKM